MKRLLKFSFDLFMLLGAIIFIGMSAQYELARWRLAFGGEATPARMIVSDVDTFLSVQDNQDGAVRLNVDRNSGARACDWGSEVGFDQMREASAARKLRIVYVKNKLDSYCVGDTPPAYFGVSQILLVLLTLFLPIPLLRLMGDVGISRAFPARRFGARLLRLFGQLQFLISGNTQYDHLYGMLIKLVQIDGSIHADEISSVHAIASRLTAGETSDETKRARRLTRKYRSARFSFRDHAIEFRKRVKKDRIQLELAMESVLRVAVSDGRIGGKEEELIVEANRLFGFDTEFLEKLRFRVLKEFERNHPRPEGLLDHDSSPDPLSWAYLELESFSGAPENEVKQSYRDLVKRFHPDKLKSRGVNGRLLTEGTRRFMNVQKAYEAIQEQWTSRRAAA